MTSQPAQKASDRVVAEYRQPHGTIITLRRWKEPRPQGYLRRLRQYDHHCERLVNGGMQAAWYWWWAKAIDHAIRDWKSFERRCGSERLR